MFYWVGIVLTFFLVILLLTKKSKTTADRILTLWLLIIGVHLFFVLASYTGQILSFPYLLGLNFPFPLLHGPFLFLYTGAITNQESALKYRVLHFVPVVVMYGLLMPYFFLPASEKVLIYQNDGLGYEMLMMIMLISIMISGVVYVVLSLRMLSKHNQTIQEQFSSAERKNLLWLRYLIYGIGIIWVFVIFGDDMWIFNGVVVFIFFLGYFGIKQVGIFTEASSASNATAPEVIPEQSAFASIPDIAEPVPETGKIKYLRSGLTEIAANEIHLSLTKAMNEKKYFTNSELTLTELASALAVHPNNLSQVINSYEGKTFYDYVNTLRIEEFKRLAIHPESQKFTLLALALDCGFNSKTSFNRNFKNVTGQSPSEYLAQVSNTVLKA